MRINFYSHLDPYQHSGGGELVLGHFLSVGSDRGHDIKRASGVDRKPALHRDPELSILADLFNIPTARRRLNSSQLQEIIRTQPFIHMDNAYVDVCDLNYLPCNGVPGENCCEFKRRSLTQYVRSVITSILLRRTDFAPSCFGQRSAELYRRSLLNIFLSPLHRQTVQRIIGEANVGRYHEYYPWIDGAHFYDRQENRDIDYLFAGVPSEAKGIEALRAKFKDGSLTVMGQGAGADLGFANALGYVPYPDVPLIMNRAKKFVFLPRWPEPFGRVVVEAAMCGCKLEVNESVGALSYSTKDCAAAEFKNDTSTCRLWQIIEGLR